MTNLLRLELDIAGDFQPTIARITKALTRQAAKLGLTVELVDECGPAGGNPLYAFTGTREALLAYLHAYMNPGLSGTDLDEEFEYYLESAEPV